MECASPVPLPRRCCSTVDIAQRLSFEIRQKLQNATQSRNKEAAEELCKDIFLDLIGAVEAKARQVIGTSTPCRFYQILAEHYTQVNPHLPIQSIVFLQHGLEAERMLEVCRTAWGRSYMTAIFALLLHRWLLEHEEAGGKLHRQKYLNVLLTGCRQLMWTDIESNDRRFAALFESMMRSTIVGDWPNRTAYLLLLGQFLPHYATKESVLTSVMSLPFESHASQSSFTPDALFLNFTEMLKRLDASEASLVHYLSSLQRLSQSPLLLEMQTVTKLQFQAVLYGLTASGGPRYASVHVRDAAFSTLNALYPTGRRTRKVISQLFRIFHPLDWPRNAANAIAQIWISVLAFVVFILSCFRRLMGIFR